jgi:uncharacterized protein YceK
MKWTRALTFLLAIALCTGGCATINDMTKGDDGQRIYGGVRQDAAMVRSGSSTPVVLGIVDFPFSLGLDTALLPITLLFAIFR